MAYVCFWDDDVEGLSILTTGETAAAAHAAALALMGTAADGDEFGEWGLETAPATTRLIARGADGWDGVGFVLITGPDGVTTADTSDH